MLDATRMPAVRLAIEFAVTNWSCVLTDRAPHPRFLILQRPRTFPPKREWDHFVSFGGIAERL